MDLEASYSSLRCWVLLVDSPLPPLHALHGEGLCLFLPVERQFLTSEEDGFAFEQLDGGSNE